VTGSTHPSHCATQSIYATVSDSYAQNSVPTITLTKIPRVFRSCRSVSMEFSSVSSVPNCATEMNATDVGVKCGNARYF